MVADLGLVVYNFAHSTVCTILLDIVGLNDELVLDLNAVEPNGGSRRFPVHGLCYSLSHESPFRGGNF